ncbi:hypothetical protein, partial [Desulfobacula sp.]|uniref:hypothetical protein n=1 Tax=Desulfobacula sp. TaxID=2593537 RepID=UPI0026299394
MELKLKAMLIKGATPLRARISGSIPAIKKTTYPIGSGEIESAHKSIPQKKLKISGASLNSKS